MKTIAKVAGGVTVLYPISVPQGDTLSDLVGYIDSTGTVIISPSYLEGGAFSEGLAAVIGFDSTTVFIDASGQVVFPTNFAGASSFHEGRCAVGLGAAVGYIDPRGTWAIAPEYLICRRFSEGLAFVSRDGDLFSLINRDGLAVTEPQYDGTGNFHNALCAISVNGKWGYINPAGSMVIPCMYDGPRAQAFTGGRAGVSLDSRWGFIDSNGHWLVKPAFDDIGHFSEGFAPAKVGDKWGVLHAGGSMRLAPIFEELSEFSGGMAPATLDGRSGFVTPEGQWIIEPRFDRCKPFVGDLAVVAAEGRYSYISRSGTIVWTSEPGAYPPTQSTVD